MHEESANRKETAIRWKRLEIKKRGHGKDGESIFFVKFKISLEIHVQYIHTLLTCLSSCCVFTLCQSHNFSKLNNG